MSFDFGSNWEDFSKSRLDSDRLQAAAQSLLQLLGDIPINNRTIIDVGCGTGLFSIAAQILGAKQVTAIDINPKCIEVSKKNAASFLTAHQPEFRTLSILDRTALTNIIPADIVYAWGSLHHTGSMHTAISNASHMVLPSGHLVLAIYNRSITSFVWRLIKWFYNHIPRMLQKIMIFLFVPIIWLAKLIVTRKNPLNKERGMDFYIDVIDWIGGYPYEYASIKEIIAFVEPLGFQCIKTVAATTPIGCNEFIFKKSESPLSKQNAD